MLFSFLDEINNKLLSQNPHASFVINLLQYSKLNYYVYFKTEFLYLLLTNINLNPMSKIGSFLGLN